jgi:hypothetical protein
MREYLNLALTVTCGACWTLAYIFIIIRSFRDKTYGMPFWALSFNICWEFIFSTLLSDHGQPTQLLFNRIWVILDVFILFAYFKYGIREWPKKLSVIFFYPYSIMVLVISFGFIYALHQHAQQPTRSCRAITRYSPPEDDRYFIGYNSVYILSLKICRLCGKPLLFLRPDLFRHGAEPWTPGLAFSP